MSNFRQIDRDTGFLLPASVDEWLPEKHPARFVVEVIEGLGLRTLTGSYRGSGSASHYPAMLLGILVYGSAKLSETTKTSRQNSWPQRYSLPAISSEVVAEFEVAARDVR
jgi:transposase